MGNTARTGSNGAEEILQEKETAHGPERYTKKYRSARKEEGAEYDYCRHPAGCSNNRDLRCENEGDSWKLSRWCSFEMRFLIPAVAATEPDATQADLMH